MSTGGDEYSWLLDYHSMGTNVETMYQKYQKRTKGVSPGGHTFHYESPASVRLKELIESYLPKQSEFEDSIRDYESKRTPSKTKENPVGYPKTDQQLIDDAVKEAIARPIREAEIANRIGAVHALTDALTNAPAGTVVRFQRKFAGSDKTYSYVAFRVAVDDNSSHDRWYLTGDYCDESRYSTEGLITWMTTTAPLVTDVQIAVEFDPITWVPAVVTSTDPAPTTAA